jgi:methylglutaconyl-CoA hydratase
MSSLSIKRDADVVRVSLNRPEVRNAFDDAMIAEITEVFSGISARAVVFSGEGKVFCGGGDLNWMQRSIGYSMEDNLADAGRLASMFKAIDECPCPVIALVHGAAFGGGVGLVCCADVVLAAEGTKFCFSEVKLGLAPAVISQFALRKIGISAARRYFLTAEVFEPEEARRIGLVHEVMLFDQLNRRADDLVEAILANGPVAVQEAKSLIRAICSMPAEDAIQLSSETIARLRVSPEGQEGVKAFLEKRRPDW